MKNKLLIVYRNFWLKEQMAEKNSCNPKELSCHQTHAKNFYLQNTSEKLMKIKQVWKEIYKISINVGPHLYHQSVTTAGASKQLGLFVGWLSWDPKIAT